MPPSKARFRATWILLFAAYIILIASAALIGILTALVRAVYKNE